MKKIAVLTDFSAPAEHAAAYAFRLASALQADMLLYHSFVVPSTTPMASQVAWPMETFDELEKSSATGLLELSIQIRKLGDELAYDAYIPDVTSHHCEGSLGLNLKDLEADPDIILSVCGTHHESLSALLTGNHTRELIDSMVLPLLIVPMDTEFTPPKHLVFASGLEKEDAKSAAAVFELFRPCGKSITIAHVCRESEDHQQAVQALLEATRQKVPDAKVDSLEIHEQTLKKGLSAIRDQQPYDVLVMTHHQETFWRRVFSGSNTQRVAKELCQPLMMFPV